MLLVFQNFTNVKLYQYETFKHFLLLHIFLTLLLGVEIRKKLRFRFHFQFSKLINP